MTTAWQRSRLYVSESTRDRETELPLDEAAVRRLSVVRHCPGRCSCPQCDVDGSGACDSVDALCILRATSCSATWEWPMFSVRVEDPRIGRRAVRVAGPP